MKLVEKPTFLDVFSGCGGLSLGLFLAGWNGLFAVEKNQDAFATLEHNLLSDSCRYKFTWPEWLEQKAMMVSDLLENHNEKLTALRGHVDLMAGGPPCQGFSTAGRRNPNDPRNKLAGEYMEVVRLVRPRALLIENVRGFNATFQARGGESRKGKPYSAIVREKLQDLGYEVFSDLVCCSHFGVPQNRKRFIIIAIRREDKILEVLAGSSPIDILLANANSFRSGKGLSASASVSAKEAISDLEKGKHALVPHEGLIKGFSQIAYHEPDTLTSYQKLMRHGMNGKAPTSLRLARHTAPVIERFEDIQAIALLGKCLTPEDRDVLGIKKHSITPLHPHRPSSTVTTLPDDILHYSEPRILTVRENARLQSFPDWFEFKGKYTTGGKARKDDCPRYTQVGNAVPPLFSEAIGTLLMELVKKADLLKPRGGAGAYSPSLNIATNPAILDNSLSCAKGSPDLYP